MGLIREASSRVPGWPRLGAGAALVGLCLPLCLFVLACKKSQPAAPVPRVTRIAIAGVGEASEEAADPRVTRLVESAARGLGRAGVPVQLQPPAPQPADFALRLQLQVQTQERREPTGTPRGPSAGAPAVSPATGPASIRLRALCAGVLSLQGSASLVRSDEHPEEEKPSLELSKFDHLGMSEDELSAPPENAWVFDRLSRLVEDSAYTLGAELQLLRADSRELVTRVADKAGDEALRATAIQILGRRRERLAIPVLVGLIRETGSRRKEALLAADKPSPAELADPAVRRQALAQAQKARQQQDVLLVLRDSAIGALIEIGDRSAVRPLLDSVAFLDGSEMGKLLEAVATLGGDEAKSYLRFVSTSHPEASLRDEAKAALQRLERREAEPAPATAP